MKIFGSLASVASLALFLGFHAAPGPQAPQPFTISFFGSFTGPSSAEGTWSSTGSIDDVGGFSMTLVQSGSSPVGTPAALHAAIVLTGKQGTISLQATLHKGLPGPGGTLLTGPVHIDGGTAFYTGIGGHGAATLTQSGTDLTGPMTGVRTH
jgi:hypothetical protein